MDRGNDRPNVLIIMTDQHSKHFLGCYGNELVRTPNLDALAERGMTFDNLYCASPLCVPSRMSFMTSRTPSANQVWNNQHILPSNIPTWAHAMGAAGYETSLVGRMHFVGPDQRHGFERRPIGEYFPAHLGADRLGAPIFVDIPPETSGQTRIGVEIAGRGITTYQAYDDMVTETAVNFLHEQATSEDARPFAALVGYVLPHCPFFAPKELFDYYYERVDIPVPTPEELAAEPASVTRFKEVSDIDTPLDKERIRVARAAYYGLCEYVDMRVGEVLKALRDSGLAENTLVIYTSDHGEMAGEHGCWWKNTFYEGSVGVPMIASLPGTVPEGVRSDSICNLMDLGPTMVDLAGAKPMKSVDGHSLWSVMKGKNDPSRPEETVSENSARSDDEGYSRMVRRGKWKLFYYDDGSEPALFDLENDPDEMVDLGSDPGYQTVRDDLLKRIFQDWNPADIRVRVAELEEDNQLLIDWAKKVHPVHEDMIAVPDAEDLEIL